LPAVDQQRAQFFERQMVKAKGSDWPIRSPTRLCEQFVGEASSVTRELKCKIGAFQINPMPRPIMRAPAEPVLARLHGPSPAIGSDKAQFAKDRMEPTVPPKRRCSVASFA